MPVYPVRYAPFPIEPSLAFPDGRIANRPLLRMALVHENRFLDCYGLVDSGADFCSFPLSFAQAPGFDMAAASWTHPPAWAARMSQSTTGQLELSSKGSPGSRCTPDLRLASKP